MSKRPDDLLPEATKAVPLADAFRDNADPKLVEQYRLTTERLHREGWWQYEGAPRAVEKRVLNEFDGHGLALLRESRALMDRIDANLLAKLRDGDLTAWAREGSTMRCGHDWRMA